MSGAVSRNAPYTQRNSRGIANPSWQFPNQYLRPFVRTKRIDKIIRKVDRNRTALTNVP